MKNYYYTFEEALENIKTNIAEATTNYEKEYCKNSLKNFPISVMPNEKSEHLKVITIDKRSVRILGYRNNLSSEFPIIALVIENDGSETLVEYDKFGNCKLGDNYKLQLWSYYFEAGDYVANESFIGILENPYHSRYKFTKSFHDGKELYGWIQDAPVRICTEEEINIINECYDENKYLKAIQKFK